MQQAALVASQLSMAATVGSLVNALAVDTKVRRKQNGLPKDDPRVSPFLGVFFARCYCIRDVENHWRVAACGRFPLGLEFL